MAMKNVQLMIVDDEPAIREMCADLLECEGYQVVTAANGLEAVHKLADEPVDLVLMDMMMPVLDGLTACRLIRADQRLQHVPVIMMTAATNLCTYVSEAQHVVSAFIPKPFDFEVLIQTVKQFTA
jgi:two-component system response regulator MprA